MVISHKKQFLMPRSSPSKNLDLVRRFIQKKNWQPDVNLRLAWSKLSNKSVVPSRRRLPKQDRIVDNDGKG